jgi:F-type H+-transporting ATPase subunit epsilon
MATIHVDVVSAQESIFSGEATFVALPGENGELGIMPRHTPLITRIRPGAVRIKRADNGEEEFVFVAGGISRARSPCWPTPPSAATTSTRPRPRKLASWLRKR